MHHSQTHETQLKPNRQCCLGISASYDQEIKPWQRNLQVKHWGGGGGGGIGENLAAFCDLLKILFQTVCVSLFSILWQCWSILELFHTNFMAVRIAGTVIPNPGKLLHRFSWDAEVSETAAFCLARGQVPGFSEFQDVPSTSFNMQGASTCTIMHLKQLRKASWLNICKGRIALDMVSTSDRFMPPMQCLHQHLWSLCECSIVARG